jgi:hypothetical protein
MLRIPLTRIELKYEDGKAEIAAARKASAARKSSHRKSLPAGAADSHVAPGLSARERLGLPPARQ